MINQSVSPDANLIALGRDLAAAIAAYRATPDEDWEDAYKAVAAVARRIEPLRATSLDGLRVKAAAYQWLACGDEPENFEPEPDADTVDRLGLGLVRDLLAMPTPQPAN